jgi:hypothetical protein
MGSGQRNALGMKLNLVRIVNEQMQEELVRTQTPWAPEMGIELAKAQR